MFSGKIAYFWRKNTMNQQQFYTHGGFNIKWINNKCNILHGFDDIHFYASIPKVGYIVSFLMPKVLFLKAYVFFYKPFSIRPTKFNFYFRNQIICIVLWVSNTKNFLFVFPLSFISFMNSNIMYMLLKCNCKTHLDGFTNVTTTTKMRFQYIEII